MRSLHYTFIDTEYSVLIRATLMTSIRSDRDPCDHIIKLLYFFFFGCVRSKFGPTHTWLNRSFFFLLSLARYYVPAEYHIRITINRETDATTDANCTGFQLRRKQITDRRLHSIFHPTKYKTQNIILWGSGTCPSPQSKFSSFFLFFLS